jgi:putative hydrolase of the HAD superfamily
MATLNGPIRGVIFDFGNVIYRFDNLRILAGLAPLCGRSVGELSLLLRTSTVADDYEAGRLDSSEFLGEVSRLCGFPFEETTFIRAFTDIFTPIESTLELVQKLAPRYRLGLISNTNPWHFEHAIRTCEVFPRFVAVTLSFELKALKPDRRLFEDSLRKLGLPAEACVFIDDRPEFAEAATRLGMHGLTYTDGESLIGALAALGVRGSAGGLKG